jgi:hypothetical protein
MESSSQEIRRFSRREWLMLITILLIIEAWILNLGYVFHTQEAVISYVSFAATIASLLLAVIAIIYGFYQADGQQKTASTIATQIQAMRDVQAGLDEASGGFESQLSAITSVAADLTSLRNSLEGTHQTLGHIQSQQDDVKQAILTFQRDLIKQLPDSHSSIASSSPNDEGVLSHELAYKILRHSSANMAVFAVALSEAIKHPTSNAMEWTAFVSKHFAKPVAKHEGKIEKAVTYTTVGLDLMTVLSSVDIVELIPPPDGKGHFGFRINEKYHAAIHEAASSAMDRKAAIAKANEVKASFE